MATKRLPISTQDTNNWGELLNANLVQLISSSTGGINTWTNATRPTGLVADDIGRTGVNTSTNVLERWNGSQWVTLITSGNSRNNYDSIDNDTATSGISNITSTGNILVIVSPNGNLTTSRDKLLQTTGAVIGDKVTFNTFGLTSSHISNFNYRVTSNSGTLQANPIDLSPNTIYEFVFNGVNWIRNK